MSNQILTIKKPFDAHVHFRQDAMLRAVVPITASHWSRAIVMPNTEPPIETIEQAADYKKEILASVRQGPALPHGEFEPLMTLYLTKNLKPTEIEKGRENGISAVKYYPWGATTNSRWGYRNILEAHDVLKTMEAVGMPILLHGEIHVDKDNAEVDPYEGEQRFISEVLPQILETYPKLKISLEHMSSANAADFIEKNGSKDRLVATVTPHHLLYSREDADSQVLLRCKPLIKTRDDRDRLRALVKKGLPFVIAGTDSAPHPESKKFAKPPAFGVFSAPVAVELYTQVFDELGALSKLENFISVNGPRFYGIEPSAETITLERKDWQVTEPVVTDDGARVWPLCHKEHGLGNETIHWQLVR